MKVFKFASFCVVFLAIFSSIFSQRPSDSRFNKPFINKKETGIDLKNEQEADENNLKILIYSNVFPLPIPPVVVPTSFGLAFRTYNEGTGFEFGGSLGEPSKGYISFLKYFDGSIQGKYVGIGAEVGNFFNWGIGVPVFTGYQGKRLFGDIGADVFYEFDKGFNILPSIRVGYSF